MKTPLELEQLANRALTSLDNLQQVDANEYLYSKIVNRMQTARLETAAQNRRWMFRLTGALVLFLGINVASFYLLTKPKPASAKTTTGIAAVNQEYFAKTDTYSY